MIKIIITTCLFLFLGNQIIDAQNLSVCYANGNPNSITVSGGTGSYQWFYLDSNYFQCAAVTLQYNCENCNTCEWVFGTCISISNQFPAADWTHFAAGVTVNHSSNGDFIKVVDFSNGDTLVFNHSIDSIPVCQASCFLYGTHNETICFGDSIVVNGTTYNNNNLSGTETFINIGANNCDSVVTVNLTVLPQLTGTHNETICFGESIVVNGTTYNNSNLSGVETFINIGANNCDSVVTVNLTIQNINTSTSTIGTTITSDQSNASYQWLDCNNTFSIIPNQTAINYTPSTNGSYAVKITLGNCVDTSNCVDIISSSVNNNSINSNSFIVYPNPTKGLVIIEFETIQTNTNITLLSATGQIIKSKTMTNSKVIKFMINESKGVYFIESNDFNNKKTIMKINKE